MIPPGLRGPRRILLMSSRTFRRRTRGGSVASEACGDGRRREIAAAGEGGGEWDGIATGGDQVTACIDPLDSYIWRSTLVGCGRLHRE
jgi:hypothetical protein